MDKKRNPKLKWPELIELAEAKLERSRRKTGQLEAIVARFRRQAESGDACPTEDILLGNQLSKLLQ